MPDVSYVQPVSGLGNAVRPTPVAPDPPIVAATQSGRTTSSTDYGSTRHPMAEVDAARAAGQRRKYDDTILTGPPPTFEASLLEVERDLDAVLRRLEARCEMTKASELISGSATPPPVHGPGVEAAQATPTAQPGRTDDAQRDGPETTARTDEPPVA